MAMSNHASFLHGLKAQMHDDLFIHPVENTSFDMNSLGKLHIDNKWLSWFHLTHFKWRWTPTNNAWANYPVPVFMVQPDKTQFKMV